MNKVLIILVSLFFLTQANFAQMPASNSKNIPDFGNLNAKAKTLAKPSDPFEVMYGNLTGEVKVNITVNEKGNVIKAEAVSGEEKLRPNAIVAAQNSKFDPYLLKGKAVKFAGFLVYKFGDYEANKKAVSDALEDFYKNNQPINIFKVMDESSKAPIDLGLLNGKAKVLAKPVYPEMAKKTGADGVVKINVTVDELGNVTQAEVVSGNLFLGDAALEAAKASKFEPYLVKGKAVKFSGFLMFNFAKDKDFLDKMSKEDKAFFDDISKFLDESALEAQKLYDKGDYAGTIKLIDLSPTEYDSEALELRARANLKLNKYEEAIKDINKSIDLILDKNPVKLAKKYTFRGDIYKAEYNYVLAEGDYRTALIMDPNNSSIKEKINSLKQSVGDTTEVGNFQRELKQTLENFAKLKPVYEKKVAEFEALLEVEKKKSNVNVGALCQSLTTIKAAWSWLDPMINKTSDKISDLQNKGKVDEYFAGTEGTILLSQNSEMISWMGETYLPGKEKYAYLFDKLGCKAIEKP